MIKRSLVFLFAAIITTSLIAASVINSKLLDAQTGIFIFPNASSTPQQHNIIVVKNHTNVLTNNTDVLTKNTGTSDEGAIQSQITNLSKNLISAQRVEQSVGANVFSIQAQINHLQATLKQVQNTVDPKISAPILNYDKVKHCSSDQQFGNTNYLTYLDHFACGHLTIFKNGTSLRQFTLFVSDYHGKGKPIPISLNKTDPVMFPAWMFNGTVPGPTMRVTAGDHVRITVVNDKASAFAHSMHMHSIHAGAMDGVMGSGGLIFPGTNFTYDVVANPVGVYPYHCHMAPVQEHISRGLYGELIIDPKVPRSPAVEMVMLMNAYTYSYSGYNGTGHFTGSPPGTAQQLRNNISAVEESSDENNGPDNQFYSVNGMPFGYFGHHMIHLTTGTHYRIYLLNMVEFDPVNSFHIHGTMGNFTESGTPSSSPQYTDIVTLGQGDRGIFEFNYKFPGEFMFHSHINHFADLGWVGFFNVTKSVGQ